MIFICLQSFSLYITAQDHINTIGTKTPSATVILVRMALNKKLVLVAQMKIQLILSMIINLCWDFRRNFTWKVYANINVTFHRFDWRILSGNLSFQWTIRSYHQRDKRNITTGDLKCVLHFFQFVSFNYRQAINLNQSISYL